MLQKDKICVLTLGCVKNIVDSEKLLGYFEAKGFPVTDNPNNTDILIINTCGFIQQAIDENANYINLASKMKQDGKLKKLFVVGCFSERFKEDFKNQFPLIDNFYGTNFHKSIIDEITKSKTELIGERHLLTPKHYAYLKIQDGCEHKCAFCSIPYFKGGFVSETSLSLINEAQNLIKNGTKEIVLIAQDTTAYGVDFANKQMLPQLMEQISELDGLHWLRLMYAFPRNFPLELLDLIAKKDNIAKYIDLPIQHISSNVLKFMGRGMTKQQTLKLLYKIREKVPQIAIRTTLIVGFPNETEENFQELLDFVTEFQFERLGVFEYSAEKGTPAFAYGDPIPSEIKKDRLNQIMLTQQEISKKKNKQMVNQELEIIIDSKQGNKFIGRTTFDAPEIDNSVIIYKKNLGIGQIYKFKITGASEYDLIVK
jgi:ribosomal protein S12 methylthiotransferase